MIWWDRRNFINHAEPKQVAKILMETEQLSKKVRRRDDVACIWEAAV
jgi:hypothetical protein